MIAIAALAALALLAAQPAPDPDAPSGSPSGQPPAPSIDSLLGQPPISEDARQAAVRGAYDAAQARRGELDGRWRLSSSDGMALYVFEFSDPGSNADPRSSNPKIPMIEGSWLDPERSNLADGSGFLTSIERSGDVLTLRFDLTPNLKRGQMVVLHRRANGVWAGELQINGAPHPVVMKRF